MQTTTLSTAFAAVLLAGAVHAPAAHADTAADVSSRCGGCHQLQQPPQRALETRVERKGPALFYAGDKFRESWLVQWLQQPTRIRPTGDFPPAHVKTTPDGDVVDPETLPDHPAVDEATAKRFTAWLMTLKPKHDLIAAESYQPGRISARMGAMDFVKFKGCGACHRDTPKYGGLSGPELYTAWQRLQPAFIASYIRDPVAWEPASLMPVKHLKSPQIHKLVDYLRIIGEKEK